MTEVFDLPLIVCGKERFPTEDNAVEVRYASGCSVRIPAFTEEDARAVVASRELLDEIPLSEVSRYISNGGALWLDPTSEIRNEAIEIACKLTGYSRPMLERDYWTIGDYLQFPNNLYELLDAELGTSSIVDEWVPRLVARVRAYPRGRALHVMVGNVPMASVYSIVRSVLTKNHTVVKLPSRDLVTALAFVRALLKANGPDHPLSRSLTVGYWRKESPVWDQMIDASDLVCAWGQGSSLGAIKKRIPQGVPYLEFGPKRSFAVVFADHCDVERAALRVAHDVAVYDQEACFSPQRVFVLGDAERFSRALVKWLSHQAEYLPKATTTNDVASHVLRCQLEAKYRGWNVTTGEGWTVIEQPDREARIDHPLNRTVFVHRIESLDMLNDFVDDETQTVSVFPLREFGEKVAQVVCRHGAVRVCESGTVMHPRQGFTHDGSYPLQKFVRLAYIDREIGYTYKYGPKLGVPVIEQLLYGGTIGETR